MYAFQRSIKLCCYGKSKRSDNFWNFIIPLDIWNDGNCSLNQELSMNEWIMHQTSLYLTEHILEFHIQHNIKCYFQHHWMVYVSILFHLFVIYQHVINGWYGQLQLDQAHYVCDIVEWLNESIEEGCWIWFQRKLSVPW